MCSEYAIFTRPLFDTTNAFLFIFPDKNESINDNRSFGNESSFKFPLKQQQQQQLETKEQTNKSNFKEQKLGLNF